MAKAVEREYKYVDVYYCDEHGKNSPWKRIDVANLLKFQHEEANSFNCFATVQRYANEGKVEGEDFTAPLYFDLDYAEDPTVAQQEACKVVEFFMKELDIQEQDIQVYFSGSKGFHIIIDEKALGVTPRTDLQRVYKHIAGYIRYRLGDEVTEENENGKPVTVTQPLKSIDLVVYTVKRMLRLPYSRHQKTGLYKIELTLEELRLLSLDEIKSRAKVGNRPIKSEEKTVRRRPKAGVFYTDKLKEYEDAAATANQRYDKEEFIFTKDKPPVCVQDILEHGWKKDGDRNNATVQLACYFKAAGYTKEEVTKLLEDWVVKHTSADSKYSVRQRVANTRSVIEAIYSKENNYKRFCNALRIKTPSVYQRVKNLSGGNQQKVVISKWLEQDSELFIFDEPTVGVDVGAKLEIYKIFETLLKEGKTIIMISSYLPEVMGLADRMLIMYEGRQTGILSRDEFQEERILRLASGIKGKE